MNNYGQQGYGQPQSYGQPQQGYPQQGQPMQGGSGFKLSTDKELYCKATGSGTFFAKKGSMVGYQGNFKFSKRLLGTNQGSIVGQVMNHAARKITGENLEVSVKRS